MLRLLTGDIAVPDDNYFVRVDGFLDVDMFVGVHGSVVVDNYVAAVAAAVFPGNGVVADEISSRS